MGVYLSTACKEGESAEGEGNNLRFAFGDIQGWRKNMEDAHLTEPVVQHADKNISVFAVFDGHGGKEVSKFCQAHFIEELVAQPSYAQCDFETALRENFHQMDSLLENRKFAAELRKYSREPNPSDGLVQSDRSTSSENSLTGENADGLDGPSGESNGKKKKLLKASDALKLFQRLILQEKVKREQGDGAAGSDPTDSSPSSEIDAEDDDEEGNSDYVPNPGPPSILSENGTHVCNLADHRVMAGCTSVVCLVEADKDGTKSRIITANAGDSRAVLCRGGGVALPLSEDHKPQQEGENARIEAAGGFVNGVGRVNGNLNLSRSLGDLKYKQVPGVSREGQIISGEPDITTVDIEPSDEFFVLGCDGIWDCVSSQECCDFVRSHKENGMPNSQIVQEMMDFCVADDPRKTGGLGGDNMTFIIVDLHC